MPHPIADSAATMAGAACHLKLTAKRCNIGTGDWQARPLPGWCISPTHAQAGSIGHVLRSAAAAGCHLRKRDLPAAKLPDRVLPGSCSARHCHREGAEGWQLVAMAAFLSGHLQPVQAVGSRLACLHCPRKQTQAAHYWVPQCWWAVCAKSACLPACLLQCP